MPFLSGTTSLDAALVHHTGTMIRFVPSQLGNLPSSDTDCVVVLPDGVILNGRFRRNPANPYVAGRDVVRWIKSWISYGEITQARVRQLGTGDRLALELPPAATPPTVDPSIRRRVKAARSRLLRTPSGPRRRKALEVWERDPALRHFVLAIWGNRCQVQGCRVQARLPTSLAGRVVDVHHLTHVSSGGSDSPMNLCVLCTAHHALIHRAPSSSVEAMSLKRAQVKVNGDILTIRRDVAALFAAM